MLGKNILGVEQDEEKEKNLIDVMLRSGPFYHNVVRISRLITANQSKAAFGFNDRYEFKCKYI